MRALMTLRFVPGFAATSGTARAFALFGLKSHAVPLDAGISQEILNCLREVLFRRSAARFSFEQGDPRAG